MKGIANTPRISFNAVSLSAQKNKKKILTLVANLLDSHNAYFNSIQTRLLEKNLSHYLGGGYVTTVASGHDALSIALASLHLTKDDEVIFPANCYPTAFPVCLSGAKSILVDVDENGQLDCTQLREKISEKTKAIIVVHLYGLVGDLEEIKQIAKSAKCVLIEDCAQGFGTKFKKKFVGTYGDIACFSFYPTKNLSTLGDGGALYTKSKSFYNFFLKAKSYGESSQYISKFVSGHSRMGEIQAGVSNIYFKNMIKNYEKRKMLALYYMKQIKEKRLLPYVIALQSRPDSDPMLHVFVIKVKKRDALRRYLAKKNIPTLVHYPFPVHLVKAFAYLHYKKGDFPISEKLSKSIVSLPFHEYMDRTQIDYIINEIKYFYNHIS